MKGLSLNVKQTSPIPLDARFTCGPTELVALVGPSGSGKSTLLRAIAGLFKPEYSHILVNGNTWSSSEKKIHVTTNKRSAGMVFQNYALFPHMTVMQNVQSSIARISKADSSIKARNLLDKVNLGGLEARYPRELSGGQQQRVAVARALAREPEILLLDEPFAAVDKITRRRLYREIMTLRKEFSIPVLLVTHDLDEAATLADRLVVLHRGSTLQTGTPEEVTSRPITTAVARLMDQRNVFDGKMVANGMTSTAIQWGKIQLEISNQTRFNSGTNIKWVIPDGAVLIHRRNRAPTSPKVNTVKATIEDILLIGQSAQISLKIPSANKLPLHASLPARVVRLNDIKIGDIIDVSLDPESIHIMES